MTRVAGVVAVVAALLLGALPASASRSRAGADEPALLRALELETAPAGVTLCFTGRRFDSTLRGLGSNGGDIGYFRARWYDSGIGRFLQEDPVGDGQNWYVYADASPADTIDPLGLFAFWVHGEITLDVMRWSGLNLRHAEIAAKASIDVDTRPGGQSGENTHVHAMRSTKRGGELEGWPASGPPEWTEDNALALARARALIATYRTAAQKALCVGDFDRASKMIGEGLHTVQDIPAHRNDDGKQATNWQHTAGRLPILGRVPFIGALSNPRTVRDLFYRPDVRAEAERLSDAFVASVLAGAPDDVVFFYKMPEGPR